MGRRGIRIRRLERSLALPGWVEWGKRVSWLLFSGSLGAESGQYGGVYWSVGVGSRRRRSEGPVVAATAEAATAEVATTEAAGGTAAEAAAAVTTTITALTATTRAATVVAAATALVVATTPIGLGRIQAGIGDHDALVRGIPPCRRPLSEG